MSQNPTEAANLLPPRSPPQLRGAAALGLFVSAALMAAAWHVTFQEMWLRWFPAWRHTGWTLMERLTKGDSYYSHGPLVILTALVLVFFIHRRVGVPVRRTRASTSVGWAMFLFFALMHLAAVSPGARQVNFVSGFAFVGVLGSLLTIWGGWPLVRAYWLPVVVLLFMVPLPEVAISALNFRLKGVATDAAVWLTERVFRIPAMKTGSYVLLPGAADGTPKQLVVENVCGGLRSLISLTFFAALFAMVCRARGVWRAFLLLMAVPVALLCNIVRITALTVVAHHWSVEAAGEDSWFHGFSGLMVFVLALAVLFGLEAVIIRLGRLTGRHWSDPRLLGYLDQIRVAEPDAPAMASRGVLACLAIVAGLTIASSWVAPGQNVSGRAAGAVPRDLAFGGLSFVGQDSEVDAQTRAILETDDLLSRRYVPRADTPRAAQAVPIDLLIVFSASNRKGTHPPEVCLEGSGDRLVATAPRSVAMPGRGGLTMRELVTQRGPYQTYHLYVYKCGNSYTTSFYAQQATIFLNGLIGRDTTGALIRIAVPVLREEVEVARNLATAAAGAVMTHVSERLR